MKSANSKEFMTQLEEVNDYVTLESVVNALDTTSHNFEVADTFVEMYKDEFTIEDYLAPECCVLVPKRCVKNFLVTLNDTMESIY